MEKIKAVINGVFWMITYNTAIFSALQKLQKLENKLHFFLDNNCYCCGNSHSLFFATSQYNMHALHKLRVHTTLLNGAFPALSIELIRFIRRAINVKNSH